MQLRDDSGWVLEAEFTIEPDGQDVAVIMESGGAASRSRPRQADAVPILAL